MVGELVPVGWSIFPGDFHGEISEPWALIWEGGLYFRKLDKPHVE